MKIDKYLSNDDGFKSILDNLTYIKPEHLLDKRLYRPFVLIHPGVIMGDIWTVEKAIGVKWRKTSKGLTCIISGSLSNNIEEDFVYNIDLYYFALTSRLAVKYNFKLNLSIGSDEIMEIDLYYKDGKIIDSEIIEERMSITPDIERLFKDLFDKINQSLEIFEWKDTLDKTYMTGYNTIINRLNTFIRPIIGNQSYIDKLREETPGQIYITSGDLPIHIAYETSRSGKYHTEYIKFGVRLYEDKCIIGFDLYKDAYELSHERYLSFSLDYKISALLFIVEKDKDEIEMIMNEDYSNFISQTMYKMPYANDTDWLPSIIMRFGLNTKSAVE